jgi:hypothetical protein
LEEAVLNSSSLTRIRLFQYKVRCVLLSTSLVF